MPRCLCILLACMALLCACARPASQAPSQPAASVEDPAVTLLAGAIGDHRLVLLGEMHGTVEIPAITGALAARYAASEPVLLGLEAPSGDQALVDAFLSSSGGPEAQSALLAGEHWQDPMHDGRDSRAMFDLLERVRQSRGAGADIAVVLFDSPGEGERNARMARTMRSAIDAHPGARVLVLTGNIHAMTGTPPEMFDGDGVLIRLPTTLGQHLRDLDPLSVEFRAAAGQVWICKRAACGAAPASRGLERHIEDPVLERSGPGAAWDLRLELPRFTVSPPAVAS